MARTAIVGFILSVAALIHSVAHAQELRNQPPVMFFQKDRYGSTTATGDPFSVFFKHHNVYGAAYNRPYLPLDARGEATALPVYLQNRGNQEIAVAILDQQNRRCAVIRIAPGAVENFYPCGPIIKWDDSKKIQKQYLAQGGVYEISWEDAVWAIKDVTRDRQ
ncbi:hypothetical protein [Rhizobium binxianense]|uniref:hypothetical protein n=1 Tax=Rhizobium binxianense TaxID=3024242 RepID=UPI00234ED419|nr:hypothetical protein [Rhizobium sp. BC56]MDC7743367.1 hypothetical protein [Rhizobium sp. BC56]